MGPDSPPRKPDLVVVALARDMAELSRDFPATHDAILFLETPRSEQVLNLEPAELQALKDKDLIVVEGGRVTLTARGQHALRLAQQCEETLGRLGM